jgi:hypothetical protein
VPHDAVAVDQLLDVRQELGDRLEQRAAARHEVGGHVDRQSSHAHVGDGQPGAAACLDQIVDVLPVLIEVNEVGQSADVDEVRAYADAVIHDPRELGKDRPHQDPPVRDLDSEHLLDRAHVSHAVDHGGDVVQAIGVGDDAVPVMGLRHLLEAAMQVADHRLSADDPLPIQPGDQMDDSVRRGMRRADRDGLRLEVAGPLIGPLGPFRHPQLLLRVEPALARRVVLAERVSDERVVAQQAVEIRMPWEVDPE